MPRAAGGHNPLAGGAADSAGNLPYQQAPITGIPSLVLHPLIQKMYDETTDRTNAQRQKDAEAKQQVTQDALDSYQKAINASGGNLHQGLLNWIQTPDGHKAVGNDAVMKSVANMHQMLSSPDPNGQPQVVQLDHGLTAVNADGKWHVFTPKQMQETQGAGGKMVKGPGGAYGTVKIDPVTGKADFTPATVGGQEQAANLGPPKTTPKNISDSIKDMDTVLGATQKMLANLGATGSMGWGSANKLLAIKTPIGGVQGQAYNEAYAQAAPALNRLLKGGGFTGKQLEAQMEHILPSPGNATAYILNQQLPALQLQYRNQIANTYASLKAENRVGGAKEAQTVAEKYDAHPDHMKLIGDAMSKLQTAPSSLTKDEVGLLHQEGAAGRLPYDSLVKVHRQMAQLQMIPAEDMPKIAASDPNFNKISPVEQRPDALPPLPRAQMGVGPNPTQPNIPPPIAMPGGPGARLPQDKHGAMAPGAPPAAAVPSAPPTPGADLGMSNIQRMMTLDQPPPQAPVQPGAAPQAAPPQAEGIPPGAAAAPLPPREKVTDAGPGAGRGGGVLAALNPISSAMAAEVPPGAQATGVAPPPVVPNSGPAPQPVSEPGLARDRGAEAGATPLPDDVRALLLQINQATAAHLAGTQDHTTYNADRSEARAPLPPKEE